MIKIKRLMVCMLLLISSMEVVLAQEKLNEFVITPDGDCPFTIRPGDGEYGFVVINTTLSDLRFTIPTAPRRLAKADFNSEKQQWILTIVPNDNNYKRYRITLNSDGFKQGEIDVLVKQKESLCFDVDPLHEPWKTNVMWYIVPGLGQIELGSKPEGYAIIAGETLLLGGGVISSISAKKQLEIMRDVDASLEDFMEAKSKYNTRKAINITCYVGAAALYGIHIYRVYHLSKKEKNKRYASLTPAIMTTDETMAFGLSFNYNF
ncbi:MAG: hypothetical protein IJ622_03665 [Bacteroidales bacterium]|nr:hypothetical protein [Bacteroidales bacterium]